MDVFFRDTHSDQESLTKTHLGSEVTNFLASGLLRRISAYLTQKAPAAESETGSACCSPAMGGPTAWAQGSLPPPDSGASMKGWEDAAISFPHIGWSEEPGVTAWRWCVTVSKRAAPRTLSSFLGRVEQASHLPLGVSGLRWVHPRANHAVRKAA